MRLVKEIDGGKVVMVEVELVLVNGGWGVEVREVLNDDEVMELFGDGNDEMMEVYEREGEVGVERMCDEYRRGLLEKYGSK